ncbi:ABC transporter permease [Streptococcus sp. S784/96/1]|uniref:ABC transporter permease n=1 Tax=Streptococcus sp. S784/96/1 TaxID=2653499 RepID=UPI001386FBEF|nr:ABC transporter permease [Streptococcus sp. S784/96/1]
MSYTFKELLFFKKKYLLVESLVILMIFMVMFLSGLTNGLRRFVSAGIENMPASHFILSEEAEGIIPFSHLSEETVTAIKGESFKGMEELAIQRSQVTTDDEKVDVTYFILEDNSDFASEISDGNAVAKENEIILDQRFQADDVKIGDVVLDKNGKTELTVVGFTKGAMYGHTGIGYISRKTYENLMTVDNSKFTWSSQAFVTSDEAVADLDLDKVEVWSKADLIEKIPGYAAEQGTLRMITWVLVVASAAVLAVFFYIISLDKRQQFGVLKALGMGMGSLAAQQLFQVFILALVGVLVGDALTLGLASVLPVKMPFYLNLSDMGILSVTFITVTVVASLLSVSRIAKIDPIDIINGGEA